MNQSNQSNPSAARFLSISGQSMPRNSYFSQQSNISQFHLNDQNPSPSLPSSRSMIVNYQSTLNDNDQRIDQILRNVQNPSLAPSFNGQCISPSDIPSSYASPSFSRSNSNGQRSSPSSIHQFRVNPQNPTFSSSSTSSPRITGRSTLNDNAQLIWPIDQIVYDVQNPSSSPSFNSQRFSPSDLFFTRSTLNDDGQRISANAQSPSFASSSSITGRSTMYGDSQRELTNPYSQEYYFDQIYNNPNLASSVNNDQSISLDRYIQRLSLADNYHHPSWQAVNCNNYNSQTHDYTDEIDRKVKDEKLCRELQDELETMTNIQKKLIYEKAKLRLLYYALHRCANYFVQKLIEVVEPPELEDIVYIFSGRFKEICCDDDGNKVMVKLVHRLRSNAELQIVLMSSLSGIALELTSKSNCTQLIENCMDFFVPAAREPFLNKIANDCITIAKNKNGCIVLQKCFHRKNLHSFIILVESLTQKALELSKDRFGNYVMQHLIELEVPFVAGKIAAQLRGNFIELSKGKESSNVVEKLMKYDANVAQEIILEIMHDRYDFMEVLQNEFGNFVGQTALKVAQSKNLGVYNDLTTMISNNILGLRNHPHGRNVCRALNSCQNSGRRIFNHHR